MACVSPCATCVNSATECLSCEAGATPFLKDTTCFAGTSCGDGYWPNDEVTPKICDACSDPCATCSSATVCITCNSTPTPYLHTGGTCVSTCPDPFYEATTTCEACIDHCDACINGVTCSLCDSMWFVNDSSVCAGCLSTYPSLIICRMRSKFLQRLRRLANSVHELPLA